MPDGSPSPVEMVFEAEAVTVTGAVPDEDAAERVLAMASNLSVSAAPVIDQLTINPSVPRSVPIRITELDTIRFDPGTPAIEAEHAAQLDRFVELLRTEPTTGLVVVGNSDQRGPDDRNVEVSQERADAVVAYLVDHGVDPSRLVTQANGEANPIVFGNTEEAYSVNRRIDYILYGTFES